MSANIFTTVLNKYTEFIDIILLKLVTKLSKLMKFYNPVIQS